MSTIAYAWSPDRPPAADVYTTRRNQSKYQTLRYWDGAAWWEIGCGGRGGTPFKWPKKSRTRMHDFHRRYNAAGRLVLRKIGVHQGAIEWGTPYKVFDEREVLAHLVKTGRLHSDWRNYYQAEMRGAA